MTDFDQVIARNGSCSVKHDGAAAVFGTADLLPMWVADMDFAIAEPITSALQQRIEHPVLGYTLAPESLYQALMDWMYLQHGWSIQRDWIVLSPGVVPSLYAGVMALTQPGDGVIIQPPIYPPFFTAANKAGRYLIENPLRLEHGHYTMDLDHLESCMQKGARLLLLCSPHNPVGRVWQKQELLALISLCQKYRITLFSDEIHADLVFPDHRHYAAGAIAPEYSAYDPATCPIVTAVAPSKTFNIPGLALSALIIPDATQREALRAAFAILDVSTTNPYSLVAFEAAYRSGKPWLDALRPYLQQGYLQLRNGLNTLEGIQLIQSEGTYLAWLDCRGLNLSDAALKSSMISKAKLGLNPGLSFGEAGRGFMRMNLGTRHAVIAEAIERLHQAFSH